MGRFFVIWLLTSGIVGVFLFVLSNKEKIATIKTAWRVLTALIIGAILTLIPLILNNLQGL